MSPLPQDLRAQALDDVKATAGAVRRNAIIYTTAGVLAFFAAGALLIAIGIYLAETMDPEVAALVVALGLVVIALLLVAVNMWLNRRERQRHRLKHAANALKYSAILSALPYLRGAGSPWTLAAVGVASYFLTRWRGSSAGE